MNGVTFGEKHSYNDWNLILESAEINFPDAKTKTIKVPLRDGEIDATTFLTDDVKYEKRTIVFSFGAREDSANWNKRMSEIANYLQGIPMRIKQDDEPDYFFYGIPQINKPKTVGRVAKFTITCSVDPYKYYKDASDEDWIWDTFCFETDYATEAGNVSIDGSGEIKLLGSRMQDAPTITCDVDDMTVTYEGQTFNVKKGTHKQYGIIIKEGENTLIFNGTGTVSVHYRGGSL